MIISDIVVKLAPRVKEPLRYIYALIPKDWRMGNRYHESLAFLEQAQWWETDRIRAWQFEQLKKIIHYAYDNTSGYNALYRQAHITPEDVQKIEDVRFLPFTTKELLRDNLKEFCVKSSGHKLRYVTTGGSTGIPFGFYHTEINQSMENAFMHSGWKRIGWKLNGLSAVLRGAFVGSEDRFWKFFPTANELALSSYYLTSRNYSLYKRKIEEFHPLYLQAYPSAASALADLVLEHHDEGRIDFQIILLGSENLYDWQKEKIRRSFPQAKLFSWYGHAEQVVLAPWCEKSETHHVWPFYGWTEIVNDKNEEVQNNQSGEIVGTSFWNYGTPFIRYRTMDSAIKLGENCPACKRNFITLGQMQGRLQEFIVTATGRLISMTAINMHSGLFDNIKQFQFYQDTPGKVIFRVIPKPTFEERDAQTIYKDLKSKLGEDTDLEIVAVEKISRPASGKFRFLEQKLAVRTTEESLVE